MKRPFGKSRKVLLRSLLSFLFFLNLALQQPEASPGRQTVLAGFFRSTAAIAEQRAGSGQRGSTAPARPPVSTTPREANPLADAPPPADDQDAATAAGS